MLASLLETCNFMLFMKHGKLKINRKTIFKFLSGIALISQMFYVIVINYILFFAKIEREREPCFFRGTISIAIIIFQIIDTLHLLNQSIKISNTAKCFLKLLIEAIFMFMHTHEAKVLASFLS